MWVPGLRAAGPADGLVRGWLCGQVGTGFTKVLEGFRV